MATRDLRDELAAIDGVSDAEITMADDNRPTARVWLDGTREGDEVRKRIESLLGRSIPFIEPSEPASGKRSGLGKGLDTLLPDMDRHRVPTQLLGVDDECRAPIERVAVVEAHGSVVVEIEDRIGKIFIAAVDAGGSIDDAVLDAVSQLVGASDETVLEVVDVVVERADLVVVEAFMGEAKGVGVAYVEFGRPYAVATAAHQAVTLL